jgi:hypothetical protein
MYTSCPMYPYCMMAKSLIYGNFHFMANQSYCKTSILIKYQRHFSFDWQTSHKIKFDGDHTYAQLVNVSFTFSIVRFAHDIFSILRYKYKSYSRRFTANHLVLASNSFLCEYIILHCLPQSLRLIHVNGI